MKIVVDLDGTLCHTPETRTEDGRFLEHHYPECEPYPERIARVNQLYDEGHTIVIDTARGASTGLNWLEFTAEQLAGWGVRYHQLRVGVKIGADLYIDDRAMRPEEFLDDSEQDAT
ncbi:MAG: hypothetical protein GWN58_25640 [Anaerolineae bacterium]|nr:hypothetical protein [Anaerolineae bacterium]